MPTRSSSASLRETTAQAVATAASDDDKPTLFDLVKRQRGEIDRALAGAMSSEKFVRIATTELRRTPRLQTCSAPSVLGALMQSAQLGLEPGAALGLAYLVPFNNKKRGTTECQLIIGYRGVVSLAARGGVHVLARSVHDADRFDVRYGSDERVEHVPDLTGQRGDSWAYYAVARHGDGSRDFEVMSRAAVEAHRDRFGNTGADSPWSSDFDAMARKTVLLQLARWLPLSSDARSAIAADGGTFRFDGAGVELDTAPLDAIDTEATEADNAAAETGGDA